MRHFTIILVLLNFSNCGFLLFKACDRSQASRRCLGRFHTNSKPNQPVLVQSSGRAFEGVRMPRSV
jgi:hypothetical protein